jgi:hypothetical protein
MFHIAAHGAHHSSDFMTGDCTEGDRLVSPYVMQVGAADTGAAKPGPGLDPVGDLKPKSFLLVSHGIPTIARLNSFMEISCY